MSQSTSKCILAVKEQQPPSSCCPSNIWAVQKPKPKADVILGAMHKDVAALLSAGFTTINIAAAEKRSLC